MNAHVTATDQRVFFFASGSQPRAGRELYVSDGTASGTQLVVDLIPGTGGLTVRSMVAIGDNVVFIADDGQNLPGIGGKIHLQQRGHPAKALGNTSHLHQWFGHNRRPFSILKAAGPLVGPAVFQKRSKDCVEPDQALGREGSVSSSCPKSKNRPRPREAESGREKRCYLPQIAEYAAR